MFNGVPYYQVYQDHLSFWRWRFCAANNEIIASGEGYYNKADCLNAIHLLANSKGCRILGA